MILSIILALLGLFLLAYFTWRAPRLASVIIWSLACTLLFSTVMFLWLPVALAEKALLIALSVPVTCVAMQYWCYHHDSAKGVAATLISLSLICAAIVAVSPPLA